MTRVIVSDCLFAACSISLANNTYKIANMSPAYVYLESKVRCAVMQEKLVEYGSQNGLTSAQEVLYG